MCETIEFEAKYRTATIRGYVLEDEIDSDEPLHFYTAQGFETSKLPIRAGTEDEDEPHLYEAFTTDSLLLQYLADFSNESKTIDREDYCLLINGGDSLVMSVEKVEEKTYLNGENHNLNAKVSFHFADIVLEDDFLEELADNLDMTWNGDKIYELGHNENAVFLEIDNDWWDDDYGESQRSSVEKEMLSDAESVFVKQILKEKDIAGMYYNKLKEFFVEVDNPRKFDKEYISDSADNYVEMLECLTLDEISSTCTKELLQDIIDDIRE